MGPTSWVLVIWLWSKSKAMRGWPAFVFLPGRHRFRRRFSPSVYLSLLQSLLFLLSPHLNPPQMFFFNLCLLQLTLLSPFLPTPHSPPQGLDQNTIRASQAGEGEGEQPKSTKQVCRALSPFISYQFGVFLNFFFYHCFISSVLLALLSNFLFYCGKIYIMWTLPF